ncbi:hypothetical protein Ae201684_016367 [Aphanomyces euteiches]|uniref:Uncharacterized protein n=1 Tax=Aphanomyces euteiches TaxID=100861 RepID=A0A6G0WFH3_9STRA|nr:hypothetical protein Ae201684_016367 [Aphanomyces euteiches]
MGMAPDEDKRSTSISLCMTCLPRLDPECSLPRHHPCRLCVYSASSARTRALGLVMRMFNCSARVKISLRLRPDTLCATSAQYLRLCINN